MANTSSAKKMVRKIATRTARIRHQRSQMRSSIRQVGGAIASGSKDDAVSALRVAQPLIAKAGRKVWCISVPLRAKFRGWQNALPPFPDLSLPIHILI